MTLPRFCRHDDEYTQGGKRSDLHTLRPDCSALRLATCSLAPRLNDRAGNSGSRVAAAGMKGRRRKSGILKGVSYRSFSTTSFEARRMFAPSSTMSKRCADLV